jgi:acyl-CoA synthetase (NDP forming)
VSYGNQIDVTVEELLEYLADDETVTAIGAYIEDVKDGRRFFNALKKATSVKPVAILKGGRTKEGARAAASHTGAMAGSQEIFSTVMKQLKCIHVDTFEQMIDVMMLATSYKMPKGHRIGFLGAGGGTSVLFTDLAHMHGLSLPALAQATQEGISTQIRNINTCTVNPVDLGAYGFDFNIMAHTMKQMDKDPNVDVIIPYFNVDFITTFQNDQIESGPHIIVDAASDMNKPVVPIFSKFTEDSLQIEEARIRICSIFKEAGLAVYDNPQDCIFSLRELLDWSEQG